MDGSTITKADIADNEWGGIWELCTECVEYTHDFADGVVSSPCAVWIEDVVFFAKRERFGVDEAAACCGTYAACETVFWTFPDEDSVAFV